jgi:polysaccharide biosynthesis/export protein
VTTKILAAALATTLLLVGFPMRVFAQASEYKIRPYDQIQVTIAGASLLSQTVTVLSDGTVLYPFVGSIRVEGLTTTQLTDLLAQRLKHYFNRTPQLGVNLLKTSPALVNVLGAVEHGGAIQIQNGDRLVDVITKAGVGPDAYADLNHITVNRLVDGVPQLYNVNLYNMLLNADYSSNMLVRDGDTVYVPKAKQRNYTNLPITLYYLYLLATPHARL